ncbi:hypothetical protein CLNEO_18300 [Anaerotignum neopropionicum]|uniref:DUF3825 domain-containing protein n=1 Tax=Anaerotignum neopropionicum TaxID=36847 RepID=A0A136WE58_9FIRM|nr:DUF3825 domain-containing protein [Anaerotignum neopropionicum]KXL52808.1 hypothetical protein CLNEO_18300 [Anaerotignum neopropionicum]
MEKYYDETKSGLYSLGYISNETVYISDLQKITRATVTGTDLDTFVQNEINSGKVGFYEYKNGNPSEAKEFNSQTRIKFIDTGYLNLNNDNIIAYFKKDKYGRWSGVYFCTKKELFNRLNAYNMGLIKFRSYQDANDFICTLHSQLMPGEKWDFAEIDTSCFRTKTQYPILESYITQVFSKLFIEYDDDTTKNHHKIVFSEDRKHCIFNSGLLTKYAKDVIIIGDVYEKNGTFVALNNPRKIDSKIKLTTEYNFLSNDIKEWPHVIEFFVDINDIIFDTRLEIDMTEEKLNHSIVDGIERNRFPEQYKNTFDESQLPSLASKLEAGIKTAKTIATRNYKYVVPQYRPQRENEIGKIQFLMPIYLEGTYGKEADFALVLNRVGDYYIPETILELSMAYNNARLICKPDDSWLNPNIITEMSNDDEIQNI